MIDDLCPDETGARGHAGDVRARHVRPAFLTVRPQLQLRAEEDRGQEDGGRLLEDAEIQGEEPRDDAQQEEPRDDARQEEPRDDAQQEGGQEPRGEPEKPSQAGAAEHLRRRTRMNMFRAKMMAATTQALTTLQLWSSG